MIPVNEPVLKGNEKKYLNECIDSGWISSEGGFVNKFEDSLAERVGRRHAIAVSNGTAAIDTAIEALGISEGDEVIVPTFTIISCVLQIVRVGAIPVLVDVDKDTWNVNPFEIERKITSKTKAIMLVHIYGLPVDMNPIINLAVKYNLKIIEDAAEAIGQKYRDKYCGSFGDISTFSFYPNKHITTGEGGMILTDCDELAKKCRELRNLCFIPPRRFIHEDLGWNFRMTNLQAAVGLAQFEKLDEFIVKKRMIGGWYNELLSGLQEFVQLPLERTEYAENIYWVYGLVLKENVSIDALEVMRKLSTFKIGSRPFFYPIHLQPALLKKGMFTNEKYKTAERLSERGFYLPSGLSLTKIQAIEVSEKLKSIIYECI
jgi:perosamine synthetase